MLSVEHPQDQVLNLSTQAEEAQARRRKKDRKRTLMHWMRRVAFTLLFAGIVLAFVFALRPQPVGVDVGQATRGSLEVVIEESGVTRVKDRYSVSAPVAGHLLRVSLEPNDIVTEGQVLATLVPGEAPLLDQRSRAQAEARLSAALSSAALAQSQIIRATTAKDLAVQDLARKRSLAKAHAISEETLEQAQFIAQIRTDELSSAVFGSKVAAEEARVARMALTKESTHKALEHVDVLSPVSGRVLRVLQKSAGIVAAGTPLLEVGEPGALEVVVDLLTTDAVQVRPGSPVVINGWGGPRALSGRVRQIEPSAFTRPSALGVDEQRVNVVVVITDPRENWAALGDGYRVEVRLVLWHGEGVTKVPQGAVFRSGNGWAVFVLENDVARLTRVQVGQRGETEVEVTSGVRPGVAVLVHPGDAVRDGVRVRAR